MFRNKKNGKKVVTVTLLTCCFFSPTLDILGTVYSINHNDNSITKTHVKLCHHMLEIVHLHDRYISYMSYDI